MAPSLLRPSSFWPLRMCLEGLSFYVHQAPRLSRLLLHSWPHSGPQLVTPFLAFSAALTLTCPLRLPERPPGKLRPASAAQTRCFPLSQSDKPRGDGAFPQLPTR